MSKVILFQGDSITDGGRTPQGELWAGCGYVTMVKGQLGYEKPDEYTFYNRGVSGNRVVEVYARMKADIINLKPDYMSILIGVNNAAQEISSTGMGVDRFEQIYTMLIEDIKQALPDIKIMILEPFVLRGSATDNTEEIPNRWEQYQVEIAAFAAASRRVAEKFNLPFIELQEKFNKVSENMDSKYWIYDGVHPTAMGHNLIKEAWLEAFNKLI